ncbi:MAG: putative porin [Bacteroidaceae bacterium]|nr:putative porin [Bacteroidaceae bacterium]
MKAKILSFLLLLAACNEVAHAQFDTFNNNGMPNESGRMDDGSNRFTWGRDTTKTQKTDVPEGFHQWTVDELLGDRTKQENDTLMFGFQRSNDTDGPTGQYQTTGNLGSPRLSRIFFDRPQKTDAYVIPETYDFGRPTLKTYRFWNTKSPFTSLTYHSAGDSQQGEDHLKAIFATNINKQAGLGFLIDYNYGRGYYANQANSLFNGSLYGYYYGDKYEMTAWFSANHFKTTENGGIEDDRYVDAPEQFERGYTTAEIPTNLTKNWNRNDDQTYFLTHRYNIGYYRDVDMPDSVNVDSLLANDSTFVLPQEFIPVTSIIHTFRLRHLAHINYCESDPGTFYLHNYYGDARAVRDEQYNTNIRNTLGLSLREGFSKWVPADLTVFATHDCNIYKIPTIPGTDPDDQHPLERNVENDIYVGGSLRRAQGNLLHFNVVGEVAVLGNNVGNFDVHGDIDLNFPLFRDTCHVVVKGSIANTSPNYFWRHWHSQHVWWDKDLHKEFRTRAEGIFSIDRTRTRLRVGWENISNYTYLKTMLTPVGTAGALQRSYDVDQCGNNISVFSVALNQHFKWGILNWENEVVWQKSTNETVLDLPMLSLYTNLFLRFRIAKVLRIEIGGDLRFWTKYYAADYSPSLNQYTVQDADNRIKVGNHPIIGVYVNAQLKRVRFYVSAHHLNAGSHYGFRGPHYPINPMNIHFGLSWNFVN